MSAILRAPSRVFRWWLQAPADLTARERWYYGAALVAHPASVIGHGSAILVFWYWGIWQMALFNVGSVIVWIGMGFLLRRRLFALNFFILAAETTSHAVLATMFLGWASGAQLYLILVAIATVLAPIGALAMSAYVALSAVAFIAVYMWCATHAPWAQVDKHQLAIFQAVVATHVFGIGALVVGYVRRIATTAEAALEAEHERSENLLKNVLPETIASRLKSGSSRIAEGFSEASILFADVVGFTELCARAPATTVVDMLDELFSAFDRLVDDLRLEKIKTIGDCYMVAAGVPEPRADHAEALADLAIAFLDTIKSHNELHDSGLNLRIGIHSGPVIAGVIGKRRFLYDMWGDSVNTAARLESHSEPGKIQVSHATYLLLRERFLLAERGIVTIKSLGEMRTYWLLGRTTPSCLSAQSARS
jgi:adenylate cyclase